MTNSPRQSRKDPIRKRFFASVEDAERISDWMFWVAILLSVAAFLAPGTWWSKWDQAIQISFLLVVTLSFFLGLALRLHWTPRAEDERRRDFLSNAFGVGLTHNQTTGYYNNSQTVPIRRLAANLMENAFFTSAIASRMAVGERIRLTGYLLGLAGLVLCRGSSLGLIAIVAQAILSEQVLSRWLRGEWLRVRSEQTYSSLHDLFRLAPTGIQFEVKVLEVYALYETSKAGAGVTLSHSAFKKLNPVLSKDWEKIKATLNI